MEVTSLGKTDSKALIFNQWDKTTCGGKCFSAEHWEVSVTQQQTGISEKNILFYVLSAIFSLMFSPQ